MAMTSAGRQARYRERVEMRGGLSVEGVSERERQAQMAAWIADTRSESSYRDAEDVSRECAFLSRVADRPLWHRQGFAEWLETIVNMKISRDVTDAPKAEKREASVRRRKGSGPRPEVKSTWL